MHNTQHAQRTTAQHNKTRKTTQTQTQRNITIRIFKQNCQ